MNEYKEVKEMQKNKVAQIEGMLLIIDHGNVKGLTHWCDELQRRRMPAVIQIEKEILGTNCELIKELSGRGLEICGAYNKKPFWNEPYSFQYEEMSIAKDKIQACIGKPMRIFGSTYSAYDETTLRAADALGVEHVFARGAVGARAVVFKAEEYNTKLVSVSNVPSSGELGIGSLCDVSLWSRGETPDGFREILFNLQEDRIILVAQTQLSGVKLHWWNVYQDFFNANIVSWESLDEFAADPIVLPNAQIPVNTEMKYKIPQPKLPLEQEEDYPFDE